MGTYVKGVVIVLVLLFLVTFGVKNSQPVQLNYYFGLTNLEIPLYGLVYLSLLIGVFVGMGVGIFKRIQLGRAVKRLQRQQDALQVQTAGEKKAGAEFLPVSEEGKEAVQERE